MDNAIAYSLDDGTVIYFEERATEQYRGETTDHVLQSTQGHFERALKTLKPMILKIHSALYDPIKPPNEIEVEFGVNLKAAANVMISSSSVEAHFKVRIKWNSKSEIPEKSF